MIGRAAGTTSSTGLAGVRTTVAFAISGSHWPTGSSNAIRPSSTNIMTAAAVMGLVIEARRKIESLAIGAPPTAFGPGCHLGLVAASHEAHRSRHRPVAHVPLQNLVQVSHRSNYLAYAA